MSNNNEEVEEEEIKVILVGEPGTGKTSLINVSVGAKFQENTQSTLLSTFVQKKIDKNGKNYILNIWDTAGQEKYHAVTKIFIKNSKIVVLVYAINNKESFKGLQTYWYKTLKDALGEAPVFGMVGNKSDLFLNEEVKENEAMEFANEKEMKYKLVTAKNNPEGFIAFLNELLDQYIQQNEVVPKRDTIFIEKDNNNNNKKVKKKCCK